MKRSKLLVAISLFVSAGSALAADEPRAENPRERNGDVAIPRGEGRRDGRSSSAAYIETLDKAVGLTDAQKKSIVDIFDARDLALKDFEAKNADAIKAASQKMQDARASNDREAMAKARGDYSEILAPMHDIMKKADDDLAGVLTAKQKTKEKEYRITAAIKRAIAPIELTDDQVKKLIGLVEAHEGERGSVERTLSDGLDQMLTAEQKDSIARHKALEAVMRTYGSGRLLSREQAKEALAFYDEVSKDATLKGDEAAKKLTDKINGLLTDEQKEAIKNAPAPGTRERDAHNAADRSPNENPPAARTRDGAATSAPAPAGAARDGAPAAPGGARNPN
ncbi:MAG TPA: hypothetical protein VG326_07300 [Tepidisphaeraceae bacterium]|jgi:hypothetical protein|nr:hypothetical protein [Tepidisphaeraceae bacterium]